jgi:acyl transferase domain-containing protein/phosphopantetheinyl transferase
MKHQSIDLAIIGMDCIFPGAPDMEAYWANILAGVDATGDPPKSWDALPFFDPNASASANERSYCKRGGYIEEFARFDPAQFGIMPGSIDGSDPDHFLALRVAARALADSGYDKRDFDRSRTSVVLGYGKLGTTGISNSFYHISVVDEIIKVARFLRPDFKSGDLESLRAGIKACLLPFTAETCPGITANIVSGRIANRFNLQGPSFTVDAACASSLVALDIVSKQLCTNQVDMAIVGGVNANLTPGTLVVFSMLGALARSGRIRPFGAEADGTLLSEGVGMAVVKRLEDARRDGDRVYAIVRGIGSSSDGRGQGLLTPRLEGEALALSRAYESCGIAPASVRLFEAHGTATKVGDATEVLALSDLLGPRKTQFPTCALGSVKSMIGHTMLAAGMAGLIKTALALRKKILPPTLCEKPNTELAIEKTPLYLNTVAAPWISSDASPRRAGISAFGFGGINMHVVLEEDRSAAFGGLRQVSGLKDVEVFVLSAPSKDEIIDKGNALAAMGRVKNPPPLGDVAFTLAAMVKHHEPFRLAVCARDGKELSTGLGLTLTKLKDPSTASFSDPSGVFYQSSPLLSKGKLAVMVPGEGAQYAGMLRETCMAYPKILDSFEALDRFFMKNGKSPLPSQVIHPPPGMPQSSIEEIRKLLWSDEYSLPLVQAANIGLWSLVQDLEITPDALVGHSGGQNCALWFAGCRDADRDAFDRFTLQPILKNNKSPINEKTRLLAVGGGDPKDVYQYVKMSENRLFIAMDNCPNQIIVCGTEDVIERAMRDLSALGAVCSTMPFQRPYHTPLYSPNGFEHKKPSDSSNLRPPLVPVYSSSTASLFPDNTDEILRQMNEQWEKPVRFRETIECMYNDGFRLFLETGPRGLLCGFVNDILAGREFLALELDVAAQSGPFRIAQTLAGLFVNGVALNLERLYEGLNRRQVSIPGLTLVEKERPAGSVRAQTMRPLIMKLPTIDIGALSIGKGAKPPFPVMTTPQSNGEAPISGIRRAVWNAPERLLKSISCCAAVCSAQSEIKIGESMAALMLCPTEMARFSSFSPNSLRASEWLYGRLAAKDAVNQLAKKVSLTHVEILTEKSGRPYSIVSNGQGAEKRFLCSIAHSGQVAVALAASEQPDLIGIGVDIERRNRSTTDLDETGFSEDERTLARSYAEQETGHMILKFWCIKEAVAKTIGTGLKGNPRAFEIVSFDQSNQIAHVVLDESLSVNVLQPIIAHAGFEGSLVFAVATAKSRH